MKFLPIIAFSLLSLSADAHEREELHDHAGILTTKPLVEAISECTGKGGSIIQPSGDAIHDWLYLTKAVKDGRAKIEKTVIFFGHTQNHEGEFYWLDPLGDTGLIYRGDQIRMITRYWGAGTYQWWCSL